MELVGLKKIPTDITFLAPNKLGEQFNYRGNMLSSLTLLLLL